MYAAPDHIQVKMQEACQGLIAAQSHDIYVVCLHQNFHRRLKGRRIQMLHSIMKLLHISRHHRGQQLRLGAVSIFSVYFANTVQPAADPFLQSLLKLRIAGIADPGGKPHHRGFTDSQGFSKLCSRHKYGLIHMLQNKFRNSLLIFTHTRILPGNPIRHITLFFHIYPCTSMPAGMAF